MLACGRLRVRLALGLCTTRGPTGWQRERARHTLRTPMCGTRVCTRPHGYQCLGSISRGQGCRGGSPDANADARQTLRTPMIGRQVCAKPNDYQSILADHCVRA